MISNIKQCSYTLDANTPLQPLRDGQLDLLQRSKAQDISGVVGRIVEVYFNYTGNEIYKIRVQKEKITFDINGDHRELNLQNGRWVRMDGTTALADPTNISADVTCVLERIRHAYQTTQPAPFNTDYPGPYHSSNNVEPLFKKQNTSFESQKLQQENEAVLAKQAQQITDLQHNIERLNKQLAAERDAIELAFQ